MISDSVYKGRVGNAKRATHSFQKFMIIALISILMFLCSSDSQKEGKEVRKKGEPLYSRSFCTTVELQRQYKIASHGMLVADVKGGHETRKMGPSPENSDMLQQ